MFSYCNNNPVMYSDPDGHSIILACIIVGAVVGAAVGVYIGAKTSKAKTGKVNGWAVAGGIVGGGIIGGLVGWGVGVAITVIEAAATGTAATTAAPVVGKVAEKTSTAIQTYYPPNNGFSSVAEKITLEAGTIIQKTGDFVGRFTAPAGTQHKCYLCLMTKLGKSLHIFKQLNQCKR